jgi:O-antigen ligase
MDTILSHPETFAIIVLLPLFGIAAKAFGFSLQRIAKWYCYIAVFAVVVVMNSIFFPFIGGKDYFFRFSVELALIFAFLWWAFEAKHGEVEALVKGLFKKPIVWAVTAFAAAYLLACAFAYDASAAFWSNYERGEGGFQMIHYYVFFILLLLLLREAKDWKRIFGFSLVAAGLMIVYGVMANFGVSGFIGAYAGGGAPAGWWHKLIDGRFQGTLGNPAYVDPYLIFAMFYAAYLWTQRSIAGKLTKLAAWSYGVLIAIFAFFFVLGQTRGAFLGLGAGVFVFLVYLLFSKNAGLRKWSAIILGILIILGGVGFAIRNIPAVQNLPEGRLLQISVSDSTAQTRFWVWGEAWKGFIERPAFGWGPENFTVVFDKFFNPNFYVPGQNTETWFDRAHSVFFDYLAETGILGLLAYLSMFVLFFVEFFRRPTKISHGETSAGRHGGAAIAVELGLILALPVAYLVQGVAIFDVLPMYLNVFLFLAFATYYFAQPRKVSSSSS